MLSTYIAGFSLSLSLILAIGSQNAFVIKQGIKKQHVFLVCLVCGTSDAILISMGVSGFGALVQEFPSIEQFARFGGAAFLLVYSFLSFKSAFKESHAMNLVGESDSSWKKTVLICLAFTWLNPHVYLDTVVLLGSISTQYEATKFYFGLGAVSASFVFFFSLGYGARLLKPLFQKPSSWKILEFLVGVMMLFIAISLLLG